MLSGKNISNILDLTHFKMFWEANLGSIFQLILILDFFSFRIYDKEGNGFITTETLRGLISELLAPLTEEELEGILEELDEDGSGSMDFDEFCEMMMTKPE